MDGRLRGHDGSKQRRAGISGFIKNADPLPHPQRHPGAGRDPYHRAAPAPKLAWVPAFAGMTAVGVARGENLRWSARAPWSLTIGSVSRHRCPLSIGNYQPHCELVNGTNVGAIAPPALGLLTRGPAVLCRERDLESQGTAGGGALRHCEETADYALGLRPDGLFAPRTAIRLNADSILLSAPKKNSPPRLSKALSNSALSWS